MTKLVVLDRTDAGSPIRQGPKKMAFALAVGSITAASGIVGIPLCYSATATSAPAAAIAPDASTNWPFQVSGSYVVIGEPEIRSDREEVRWVKENSGLTWGQLARVFGVSQRAVHLWANGGRMNETNARVLREFASIVSDVARPSSDETRAALLTAGADGFSAVDRFKSLHRTGRDDISGTALSPAELIGAPTQAEAG